jgi:hypothetical protein
MVQGKFMILCSADFNSEKWIKTKKFWLNVAELKYVGKVWEEGNR